MTKLKDRMVRLIQQDAAEKMAAYAAEMIRAAHAADLAKHRGAAAAEIGVLVTQAAAAARR